MDASDVAAVLDRVLPDSKIVSDVHALFLEHGKDGFISIELETTENASTGFETEWTPVPVDAAVEIVIKMFKKDHPIGVAFGTYVVTVAIGGFQHDATGHHTAGYCFADLFYNDEAQLCTQDFYRDYFNFGGFTTPFATKNGLKTDSMRNK